MHTAASLTAAIDAADPAAPRCTKCKGTGSGFVAFYSSADRICTCASGLRLRLRYEFPEVAAARDEAERVALADAQRAARKARADARRAAEVAA